MPVPSSIADLSTTPASNSPAGSETPSSVDDYLRTQAAFIKQTYNAVQDGSLAWCGTAGGTANALTLTSNPAITAYAAGQVFRFKAASTNTGATTLAISGLTTVAVQINGAACAGGEIVSGQWYEAWLSDATTAQVRACAAPNQVGAINFKRATVAATATTTPLWSTANGSIQDWTGTPTITDFPAAPQAGAQRQVYPAAGTIITNAGSIAVQGGANYTVSTGDMLTITAVTATTFYVSIVKKDGTAVAVTQATTSAAGVVQLATATEAQAFWTGGNASKPVTPSTYFSAMQGANQSLGTSGYQRFPGGIVMQWGRFNAGTTSTFSVTFPIAFGNACVNIQVTHDPNGTSNGAPIISSFSTTNFVVDGAGGTSPKAGFWFAIGY